jgi:hypothetical protein
VGFGGLGHVVGVSWPKCSLSRVAYIESRVIVVYCSVYSPLVWLVCFADTVFPLWRCLRSVVVLPLVVCFVASMGGVVL